MNCNGFRSTKGEQITDGMINQICDRLQIPGCADSRTVRLYLKYSLCQGVSKKELDRVLTPFCDDRASGFTMKTMTDKVRKLDLSDELWDQIVKFSREHYYRSDEDSDDAHGTSKNVGVPTIVRDTFIEFMVSALHCEEKVAKRIAGIAINQILQQEISKG